MKLEIGQEMPKFETINQDGKLIKSSDLIGKKTIIYFYPKDNTPTCTIEACNLRDNYQALQSAGYQIFGVSIDNTKSHKKFITKFDLPFDLLVDEDHKLVEAFGVWQQKKLYGREYMGTVRTTFVFNENGIITEIIDKVNSKDHATQILKA